MDTRHEMVQYPDDTEYTEYISVYLPDVGNVSITYESNDWYEGKKLVVQTDFEPSTNIRIIDQAGNDRAIER